MSRRRNAGRRKSPIDQTIAVSALLLLALFLLPLVVVAPFRSALFGREEPVDETEQKQPLPPFVSGSLDAARPLKVLDGEEVLEMDLGTYLVGVVRAEMPASFQLEALKAQAVAARSYYATNLGRHSAQKIDICGTTHCQAYYGCSGVGENTTRAAQETAGAYLKYNGKVVEAFYCSSNGGASENSENVFMTALPYCKGKADPYEADIAGTIPNYYWSKSFTGEQLRAKLADAGYTRCGTIRSVTITKTPTGNVYSMTFLDVNGKSWTISKDNCRIVLGMNSLHFDFEDSGAGTPGQVTDSKPVYVIDGEGKVSQVTGPCYILGEDGTVSQTGPEEITVPPASEPSGGGTITPVNGVFAFRGSGLGHNVGMSQWGARAMAQRGLTYRDILTFYYTGVTIES